MAPPRTTVVIGLAPQRWLVILGFAVEHPGLV